jgi:hypothetical protein
LTAKGSNRQSRVCDCQSTFTICNHLQSRAVKGSHQQISTAKTSKSALMTSYWQSRQALGIKGCYHQLRAAMGNQGQPSATMSKHLHSRAATGSLGQPSITPTVLPTCPQKYKQWDPTPFPSLLGVQIIGNYPYYARSCQLVSLHAQWRRNLHPVRAHHPAAYPTMPLLHLPQTHTAHILTSFYPSPLLPLFLEGPLGAIFPKNWVSLNSAPRFNISQR